MRCWDSTNTKRGKARASFDGVLIRREAAYWEVRTMDKSHVRPALVLALAGLFAAMPVYTAETGSVLKADQLKAEPFRDANAVSMMAPGDKVEILQRQGGWFRVKSAKGAGWVRMLSVRRGEAGKASAESDVSGLLGLASGRAGTGKVIATTGIRGLNEEQLKAAKYSESEIKLSDSLVESLAEARKFAVRGKLAPRKIDYLPAPTE